MTHDERARQIIEAYLKNVRAAELININHATLFPLHEHLAAALKLERDRTIQECAKLVDELFYGFQPPYEYRQNVSEIIRALAQRGDDGKP